MTIKKAIRWLPALIWMGIIFYLSAQPAQESSELSSVVMHWLLGFVESLLTIDASFFHLVVRKGAHLSAYFILAVLMMYAIGSSFYLGKFRSHWIRAGLAFVICEIGRASGRESAERDVGRRGSDREGLPEAVWA